MESVQPSKVRGTRHGKITKERQNCRFVLQARAIFLALEKLLALIYHIELEIM